MFASVSALCPARLFVLAHLRWAVRTWTIIVHVVLRLYTRCQRRLKKTESNKCSAVAMGMVRHKQGAPRGWTLTFTLARVLVTSTHRWPGLQPSDTTGNTTVCRLCPYAHFGRATTTCVSSQRDWADSIGSRMQQDTGISKAPPHLGAPNPTV